MTVYELLKEDEGVSKKLYYLNGIPHIGVGHNLQGGPDLSDASVESILEDDVTMVRLDLARTLPGWTKLSEVRQAVLISMGFNLGSGGMQTFTRFLHAVANGDWTAAAYEMRNSKAYSQAKNRYDRLSRMMETDQWG